MRVLFLIILSIWSTSNAQKIQFEKLESKPTKFENFWGTDISGNNYFSFGNNLYKVTKTDTLNYANNKYGKISGVETFNMLQTIVFYKENNALVLLDAQFNEINSTLFTDINCEVLKPASQNELWFYDNFSQKFGLYNLNTNKFRLLNNPMTLKIKHCYSDYNKLYLIKDDFTYFSIDKFGNLEYKSVIGEFNQISFSDQECVYTSNNEVFYADISQMLIIPLNIHENLIKKVFFKDGILSIFTDSQIITYQIKK